MEGPFKKTLAVLTVYLDRGQKALDLAQANDWDAFLSLLVDRKAAFNNFRYWDYVCLQYDTSYGNAPEFQHLWKEIRTINDKLLQVIESSCEQTKFQLVRATHNREKLSKFRSAAQTKSGFRLGV